jgi:hypothetical protein
MAKDDMRDQDTSMADDQADADLNRDTKSHLADDDTTEDDSVV